MPRYSRGVGIGESAYDKVRRRAAKRRAAQQATVEAKKVSKGKGKVKRTSSGAVGGAAKKIDNYMVTHGCSRNQAKRALGLTHKVRNKKKKKGGFST